jgi:hypothetical protein
MVKPVRNIRYSRESRRMVRRRTPAKATFPARPAMFVLWCTLLSIAACSAPPAWTQSTEPHAETPFASRVIPDASSKSPRPSKDGLHRPAGLLIDTILIWQHGDVQTRCRLRCDSAPGGGYAFITETADTGAAERISRWPVDHPIFRIRIGDVDGDGAPELCIGLIKRTRHDPEERKRLFVYSLRRGYIRPRWLGSALGRPWSDFALVPWNETTMIETDIIPRRGASPEHMLWRWQGFGFTSVPHNGGFNRASSTNHRPDTGAPLGAHR